MGGQFETYGPFPLRAVDGVVVMESVEELSREVDLAKKGLPGAVGVYVVARRIGGAQLVPVYVGRTEAGFIRRFRQHVQKQKGFTRLSDSQGAEVLEVFFIALQNTKGFRKPVKGKNKVLAIRTLEVMLIGACLKLNAGLLNTSLKTLLGSLRVPGYLDPHNAQRSLPANQLAAMLAAK